MRKSIVYALLGLAIRVVVAFLFENMWPVDSIGYFFTIGLIGAYLEKLIEEKKSKEDQ